MDLRSRWTNSLCFFISWATIYDPQQSIRIFFFSTWATIYELDQPISYVFRLNELRSTTQNNQFAIFKQWLSYDLRPRSSTVLCFVSGWATIYDTDQPIRNAFSLAEHDQPIARPL